LDGDVEVVFDLYESEFRAFTVGAAHHHSRVAEVDVGFGQGVVVSTVGADAVGGGDVGSEREGEGSREGVAIDI